MQIMNDDVIPAGNTVSFHVTLRYRPFGANVDVFDLFTGASEKEAMENLKKYIKMCNEKYGRYMRRFEDNKAQGETVKVITPKSIEASEDSNEETQETEKKHSGGKGAHFIGTTWVANLATKDKKRIPSSELASYLAKGYIKAGPRTKV